MKLLMLKGLPGSGKTTWATEFLKNNPGWRRVNKDELRRMLWGNNKPKSNEGHLDKIQKSIIIDLLGSGFSVIVDNTHLSPKREQELREMVDSFNATNHKNVEFEAMLFATPLFQCILNDAGRPNPVGPKVIGRMYEQFLRPTPIRHNDALADAYIVDIDGTIAWNNNRNPFDYSKLGNDIPNLQLCMTIGQLGNDGDKIIFVSGRPEDYREQTIAWLGKIEHSGFLNPTLHMRTSGDNRQDAIIKREIYEREIKGKYNILGVFDDRNQVVEMWRSLGLPVYQVNYGFF